MAQVKKQDYAGHIAQAVDHLPSKPKALSSNPILEEKKKVRPYPKSN
jgi:hypothetical protein